MVWIPRLLHECVNAEYSSSSQGYGSPTVRDVTNKMDFAQKFEVGLSILRDCGGAGMSAQDYAQMSTDDLLRSFVETAKRTGSLFGPDKEKLRQTPARLALVATMQALGAELRTRAPIEKLRDLFDDEDPDVRGWAGPQFVGIDSDWGSATVTGLFSHLTTREVLAWRERILRGAPKRPRLQEMSVAQLLERFVDACERCYGSTRFLTDEQGGGPNNRKAYNKVAGEPYAVAKELKARGQLSALVPLLQHSLVTVRVKAAGYCLPVATEQAVAVLQAANTRNTSQESFEAWWTLDQWQKGEHALAFT